jgi:hypothetical protein
MTVELKVLSKKKSVTGGRLVVEDYDDHPVLCRRGVWVGWQETFIQTVTLGYEHEGYDLVVGWAVNGQTIFDPGHGSAVIFPGEPCPGQPSVRYVCPVEGHWHRISFLSTPGEPERCLSVQALFRRKDTGWQQLEDGPFIQVCVSGSVIQWPAHLVKEEAACLRHVWDVVKRYAEIAHVNPGDPVQFLTAFPVAELRQLEASAQTLERLDEKEQPALAQALRESIVGTLRSRIPDTPTSHAD